MSETSISTRQALCLPLTSTTRSSAAAIDDGLRVVIDRLPDAVLIADNDRRYVYVNRGAETLFGLPAPAILGHRLEEFTTPEVEALVSPMWAKFLADGVQSGPFQLRRSDGVFRDVDFTAVANFRPGLHISFLKDVTAQKWSERAREESERVARLALGAGRMGHWVWDGDKQSLACSEMVGRLWSLEHDTSVDGNPDQYGLMLQRIHSADREYVRQRLRDTLKFGYECELEFRVTAPSDETNWLTLRAQTMFDATGRRCGLLGICWDTTETKQAERHMRLSEVRFRTLLEQSPISTQLFAPSGACLLANRACLQFWDVDAGARSSYNILHDQQLVDLGLMPAIQQAFAGEPSELPVAPFRPGTGPFKDQEVWLRGFAYPVHDDEGDLREVVLIQEDVSQTQALENERMKQMAELVRSNNELERFVYVASHDLKEPLRNMMAFSQLLRIQCENKLDADDREYLTYIASGAQRMNNLIDSLLEYSRASLQRDVLMVASDLNELLQHAMENLRSAISQSNARVDARLLPTVRCAPLSIVQLFQNLIGNAIKYSGDKDAEVSIWAKESDQCWEFYVRDRGIGISPYFHEQIFGVFRRLHGREQPGAGVGLAICKAIVEKHGGRIWVESQEGQGATFIFTLAK